MVSRHCDHCNDKTAWALRSAAGANALAGVCLVIFGAHTAMLRLQPPCSFATRQAYPHLPHRWPVHLPWPAGATVHRPITTPGVCMVLLGLYNWGTSLAGLFGSARLSCCLDIFLVMHGLDVILTLAMVGKLWFDWSGVLAAVGEQ